MYNYKPLNKHCTNLSFKKSPLLVQLLTEYQNELWPQYYVLMYQSWSCLDTYADSCIESWYYIYIYIYILYTHPQQRGGNSGDFSNILEIISIIFYNLNSKKY